MPFLEQPYHVDFLKSELRRRKAKNPKYSLRAYSRALGVDAGALSRILSGKQDISLATARSICRKLRLSPEECRRFLLSVARLRQDRAARILAEELGERSLRQKPAEIDDETFAEVCDPLHYAILEAPFLKGFKPEAKWIAQKLGVPEQEVQEAILRLIRVGLLREERGTFTKANVHVVTAEAGGHHEARIRHESQVLRKALERNESPSQGGPFCFRNVMMAVDPRRIPKANEMIRQFCEDLCDFLESGERTAMYQLAIQLFVPFHSSVPGSSQPREA